MGRTEVFLRDKMVVHPSLSFPEIFYVLFSRAKAFVSTFSLPFSIVLTQGDRARLFGSRKWSAYQPFLDFTKLCHEKIGATFFMVSVHLLISICLKNSSQTIFLAHYNYIKLEKSPQLNFRTKKRCHFIMDSVHFKNFWTLSADHFPLPAVFFHC